jgi:hypothetical protein
MVQIAALSSQEDAAVLIGALRRRGYAVSAVRYPADRLIHVCIGPFSNPMDANSMKLKLQSDGYNAQVVPWKTSNREQWSGSGQVGIESQGLRAAVWFAKAEIKVNFSVQVRPKPGQLGDFWPKVGISEVTF